MTETFERVQLGVRLEKRMVKVLKALAEAGDQTLAQLMEDIIIHALEGECTFGEDALPMIRDFKRLYGMNYGVHEQYAHPEGAETA